MDKHLLAFYEEATELLTGLEQQLLNLEDQTDCTNCLEALLRILHTLKGTSSMFGFGKIAHLAHKIEAIFVHFKKEKADIDKSLIDLFIIATDCLKKAIDSRATNETADFSQISIEIDEIAKSLEISEDSYPSNDDLEVKQQPSEPQKEAPADSGPLAEPESSLWLINFAPHDDFYFSGNLPEQLFQELSLLGELKIEVNDEKVPDLFSIEPEKCYLSWKLRLQSHADINAIKDVFIFVEDLAEISIEKGTVEETAIVKSDGEINLKDDSRLANSEKKEEKKETSAQTGQDFARFFSENEEEDFSFSRANTERMIALLGDLVTVQSKLNQKAGSHNDPELISISTELEGITDSLRDCAMHLSMLPFGAIFNDLEKTGKDLATQNIKLVFYGGETEIDRSAFQLVKKIFLRIYADLLRFLKNIAADAEQLITLKACHQVGRAVINIEVQAAEACFVFSEQLEENGAEQHEPELPFVESFKVAEQKLGTLHGTFKFAAKDPHCLKIDINLPLNLAIIESLMVKVGKGFFLLPLSEIEECIELTEQDQQNSYKKNVAIVRGQFVPYLHIREKFYVRGKTPPIQQIVIMKLNEQRIGLVVDQVIGEYQTAIKTWGNFCNDCVGIGGAAILGDGGIALLIDFRALIAEEKELLDQTLQEVAGHGI